LSLTLRLLPLLPLLIALGTSLPAAGQGASPAPTAASESSVLASLKAANAQTAAKAPVVALSPVREAALRDTARALGVQAGLGERSRSIVNTVNAQGPVLDAKFRFSDLIMGVGILPAVISEARDAVAVDATVMRIAQSVYRIDEPARPVMVAPTWRDWLLLGLNPDLHPVPPSDAQLLPRDEIEQRYWNAHLDEAYLVGVQHADKIFDINLARLERTYIGMRRFYDLYQRGMVTAPVVAASSSIIDREDPNTVAIGATVFRITAGTDFVEKSDAWRPLGR
jgi:defect-in-organelle-trafficking protein DotC